MTFEISILNSDGTTLPVGMGGIDYDVREDWQDFGELIEQIVDTYDFENECKPHLVVEFYDNCEVEPDDNSMSADEFLKLENDNFENDLDDTYLKYDKINECWREYGSDELDGATYYEPSVRIHNICEEIGDLICDLFLDN